MEVKVAFNPTMVRLQLISPRRIRSFFDAFNPTMVRLQRHRARRYQGCQWAFNPTMVRLQPVEKEQWYAAPHYFQSHYGAIAT